MVVAGTCGSSGATAGSGDLATSASFSTIGGVVENAIGDIIFTDAASSAVYTVASDGSLNVFAGTVGSPGYSGGSAGRSVRMQGATCNTLTFPLM